MRKIVTVIAVALLASIICLQILAALNIFPRKTQIQVCPVDAISMQNGKAVIDAKKCIGCQRCVVGVAAAYQIVAPVTVDSIATVPSDSSKVAEAIKPANKPAAAPIKESKIVLTASYKVDATTCIGCGLCPLFCPVNAITLVDGKAVIDSLKCINCGICKDGNGENFAGCPVDAIRAP